MAQNIHKSALLISSLLLLFLTLPQPSTSESYATRISLLQFMESLSETFPPHSNWGWNDTSDPCRDWAGVLCDSDGRVVVVGLPKLDLAGTLDFKPLCRIQSLRRLDLTDNGISGPIPSEVANCTSLTHLMLGGNWLQGLLPGSISSLTNLEWVDVSNNRLVGPIPSGFGTMSNVTAFFAQNNQISGKIPGEMSFTSLREFNVSRNQLAGTIPRGFYNFPASGFVGNPGLCGQPLLIACAPSPSPAAAPAISDGW
ncbi:unnamed protein product [Linum tenue]|uniref:Leucine-rich repeat-containing N-terminal plant-type domain-containing protein n=1 Tax=Linum tenue TaxID=586396 RepID=A0AAV0HXJ5_9ROSI|nr:unnamed protein product [Linum tenue]